MRSTRWRRQPCLKQPGRTDCSCRCCWPSPAACAAAKLRPYDGDSVDLANAQVEIRLSTEQTRNGLREKETKTGRGRTVALIGLAVEELRRHKVRQAEELLRLGVRQSEDTHVVAQADGQPLKPNSLTHEFVRFIAGTELPRIRFHDLRHTHATQLLKSNVHPKIVQERLGHEDISTTLNLYSHVLPGMQDAAARSVDLALREALDQQRGAKTIG